jgi:acyl dehydratase
MALDLDSVGKETRVHTLRYDFKTLVLYALGIGAKRAELDYLYEGRGPKVYPSFAVVPTYALLDDLVALSQGPYDQVIHGAQSIRVHQRIPNEGVLESKGKITGIYDLKLLAQLDFETETRVDGELLFETRWTLFFRGAGGFGGARRPRVAVPSVPKREPDWVHEETISPEAALLYRLSGDLNPLHADPDFAARVGFEQGPILHGLATFGHLCRAVTLRALDGDADRIRALQAQFKKPVWPGEKLRTEGFVEDGKLLLQMYAGDRPEAVVTGGLAELAPEAG